MVRSWLPRWLMAFVLPALVLVPPQRGVAAEVRADAFSPAALTSPPRDGWRTNGGNCYNQRYSPLASIDRGNVAQLKGVWRTHLNGSGLGPQYSGEAQPIVYDGRSTSSPAPTTCSRSASTPARSSWTYAARLDPTIRPSAAAGRAAASASATARSSSASSTASSSRSIRRRARWSGPCKPSAGRTASRSRARRSTTTASSSPASRAPSTACAAASKRSTPETASSLWTFYTIPGPGELGHDTWPQDNDVWLHGGAHGLADAGRRSRARAHLLLDRQPGPGLQRRACAPATTCSRRRSSRSTRRPASTAGTSSKCITTSGTTTRRAPSCCSTRRMNGAQRKGLAQVGKTGWVYILDRDDRQAAHRHRRAPGAAGAAAGDGRDAAVPARRCVRAAADRHRARRLSTLVNDGRIFTPFWRRRGVIASPAFAAARTGRRARTTRTSSYLFVCASDVPGSFTGGDRDNEPTRRRRRSTWAASSASPRCRAAASSRPSTCAPTRSCGSSTGRPVLQRLARDGRRARVRRPQRRPADGARFATTARSSGSSRPAPA